MEVARITCEQWADDARSLLAGLPAGSARDALEQLCDAVVARRG
jgi:geranylgeranyl pyrophosphate synthase